MLAPVFVVRSAIDPAKVSPWRTVRAQLRDVGQINVTQFGRAQVALESQKDADGKVVPRLCSPAKRK